ncbi:GNAT family N-acetyltransferase [Barrientosiimonas endolithica]|nr:GNAT family N-acetyltransferase [Barrientosiimonas endolithica]
MPLPPLRTDRLRLDPLGPEHLEQLVELDSDPEVLRYLFARPRTRAEVEESMVRRTNPAHRERGMGYWAGFAGEEFIGWWALLPVAKPQEGDPGDGVLGYRLMRRAWRRGFASEGAREVLRYGFADLGLPRITAETMAVNAGSRAVMRSIGMTHWRSYLLDFDEPLPGADEGEVLYAISRSAWERQ